MRTVFVVALLAAHMASARFIRATNAGREMVQDGLLGAASGSGGSSSSQTWTIVGSVAGALLCCYCCCRFCRNVRRHAEEQERRQRLLQSSTPQPSYAVVPRSSQPSTGSSSTPGSYHLGSRVVAAVHQPGVGTIGVVDSIHLQEVRYCVTFVIDQSGSMAGDRWSRALRGVQEIVNCLGVNDVVVAFGFNSGINELASISRAPDSRVVYNMQRVTPSGGTRLRDAILMGIALSLKIHVDAAEHGFEHILVVLTDGEDTESQHSTGELHEVIRQYHAKVAHAKTYLIGVSLSGPARSAMQAMAAAAHEDIEFYDCNNVQMSEIFQKVSVLLQRRVIGVAH